jgi:hypothetical protein
MPPMGISLSRIIRVNIVFYTTSGFMEIIGENRRRIKKYSKYVCNYD